MSRIRVLITEPLTNKNLTCWNVNGIDEFIERFIRDDKIIVNDYQLPVRNFVKHNERMATFDEISWLDFANLLMALDGFGCFHNIRVNSIDDGQNPLE